MFASYLFIRNQSVVDPCQFLNPRNWPPQAPNMYVYAYIVQFEPTRGEGGHPITIGGGVRQQLGGGPGNCSQRLDLTIKNKSLVLIQLTVILIQTIIIHIGMCTHI